jgi:hypothetical protein
MQDIITIGRRLILREQIAYAEPFDPTNNPDFKSDRPFKVRVVLLNRDTALAETSLQEFADACGLHMLDQDMIAVNPLIAFCVETFTSTESFKPEKSYLTRLKWRDLQGNEHSKLLLTAPETVVAVALRGGSESPPRSGVERPARARVPRCGSRKPALVRS